ncbi:MAG: hypothetical protein ABIS27_11495 [Longimicrobiales bacterium]
MSGTKRVFFYAGMLAVLLSACSAAKPGTGRDATPHFFRTIGEASAIDVSDRGGRIVRQFGYNMRREQGPPAIEIETEWKLRRPYDDEARAGADNAQSRVIIRGRQRSTPGSLVLYNIEVNVENRLQVNGSSQWTFAPMTERFRLHADSIASELERELRNVTRR